MATQQDTVAVSLPVQTAKQNDIHPLAPINKQEIEATVSLIKSQWPAQTEFQFKSVTLEEPAKAETAPYLEAEFNGHPLPHIDRRVFVTYYLRKTVWCLVTPVSLHRR